MPRVRRTGGISKENLKLALEDRLRQPEEFHGTWQQQLPYLQSLVIFLRRKDVLNSDDFDQLGHALLATEAAVARVNNNATFREAMRFAENLVEQLRQLKPEVRSPQPSPTPRPEGSPKESSSAPSSPRAFAPSPKMTGKTGKGQAQSRGRRRQSSMSSQGIDEVMIAPEFEELYDFLERERQAYAAGIDIASDALVYMCGPPGVVFDFLSQRGMLPFPLRQVELDHWMRMVMWQINRYREDNGLSWRHEQRGGRAVPPPPNNEPLPTIPRQPPPPEPNLLRPEIQLFVEMMDWVLENPSGYTPFQLYHVLKEATQGDMVRDMLDYVGVSYSIPDPTDAPSPQLWRSRIAKWMRRLLLLIEMKYMVDHDLQFDEMVAYFTPPN